MFSDNFVIVVELLIISPALQYCYPRSQEVWQHFTFSNKKISFFEDSYSGGPLLHTLKSAAPST
jgi:hypothetical protein